MKEIYIDIETIPTQRQDFIQDIASKITAPAQYKKPESIQQWLNENLQSVTDEAIAKTSFDGGMGQIFCIGFAIGDECPAICVAHGFALEDEKLILNQFNDLMFATMSENWDSFKFVGHYISGFDLKFLFQRMVVHKIKPKFPIPFNEPAYRANYFDTMLEWAGYKDRVSLDNLCKYLDIQTPKTELDGSKVWEFVKSGKYQDVWEYCKSDVDAVRQVYKRLTFKAGE